VARNPKTRATCWNKSSLTKKVKHLNAHEKLSQWSWQTKVVVRKQTLGLSTRYEKLCVASWKVRQWWTWKHFKEKRSFQTKDGKIRRWTTCHYRDALKESIRCSWFGEERGSRVFAVPVLRNGEAKWQNAHQTRTRLWTCSSNLDWVQKDDFAPRTRTLRRALNWQKAYKVTYVDWGGQRATPSERLKQVCFKSIHAQWCICRTSTPC